MRGKLQRHSIESAFVLILFAVFAMTVVAVLALGANSYQKLVERDNDGYNKWIVTSYVAAKIRSNDVRGKIQVGGFASAEEEDGIETLHLYRESEGEKYDTRIYYYDGYIYELFTLADLHFDPEAGNVVMEARRLSFEREGDVVHITSVDTEGRTNTAAVSLRSERGVMA